MATSPKDAKQRSRKVIDIVQYPQDLGGFYFSMDFYEYRTLSSAVGKKTETNNSTAINPENKIDPLRRVYNADRQSVDSAIANRDSFAKIKLPIPNNLVDSFRVNYENREFGGVGAIMSMIGELGNNAGNAIKSGSVAPLTPEDNGAGFLKSGIIAAGKLTAEYANRQNIFFGGDFSGLYDLATGTATNPNLAVLFRGPTLKTHTFAWRVTPRTPAESDAISRIDAIVKRAMHPKQIAQGISGILRYPCECLCKFIAPGKEQGYGFLYPLRPTIVESFSINRAPNGQQSFLQQNNVTNTWDPTSLEIQLHLQETNYYLRDSFDNKLEYGFDGYQTTELTRGGVNAFGEVQS